MSCIGRGDVETSASGRGSGFNTRTHTLSGNGGVLQDSINARKVALPGNEACPAQEMETPMAEGWRFREMKRVLYMAWINITRFEK